MHDEKNNNNSSSKNTKTLSSEKKATEKQTCGKDALCGDRNCREEVSERLLSGSKGEDEVEKGGGGKGEGGFYGRSKTKYCPPQKKEEMKICREQRSRRRRRSTPTA